MQTSVLLSIKPEFVEKIFAGLKRYEFRRVLFRSKSVSRVVVYASSPVQQVVGEFEVGGILALHKWKLWQLTKRHSGIPKSYFDEYFRGQQTGFAIEIKRPQRYTTPMLLKQLFRLARPPQSFMYLEA